MIQDFLFQLEPITIVIARYPKYFENLELSTSDINLIKNLGQVLAQIEALTILFQGSSYTSIQYVLPLIFNLDIFLNDIIKDTHEEITDKDPQLKEACELGLQKLRKYFNPKELSLDEIEPWAISIILDPRLRFSGFTRWGISEDIITLLRTRFKEIFNRYEYDYKRLYPENSTILPDIELNSQQERESILDKAFNNIYGNNDITDNEIDSYLKPGNKVAKDVSSRFLH
jgi:hypothetical protein